MQSKHEAILVHFNMRTCADPNPEHVLGDITLIDSATKCVYINGLTYFGLRSSLLHCFLAGSSHTTFI